MPFGVLSYHAQVHVQMFMPTQLQQQSAAAQPQQQQPLKQIFQARITLDSSHQPDPITRLPLIGPVSGDSAAAAAAAAAREHRWQERERGSSQSGAIDVNHAIATPGLVHAHAGRSVPPGLSRHVPVIAQLPSAACSLAKDRGPTIAEVGLVPRFCLSPFS